jgi:hypothetical protein
MDWVQGRSNKEEIVQGGIVIEDPSTQEVLVELKEIIIHQIIHPQSHMHLMNQRIVHKCPQSYVKKEDMI